MCYTFKMYKNPPLEKLKTSEVDENGDLVNKFEEQVIPADVQNILNQDKEQNHHFKLKHVKKQDLLLLSTVKLEIGDAKELKQKIKTMDELLELIE